MTHSPEVPDCMQHLGGNRYRCVNLGVTIRVKVFPLHCACDGRPSDPHKMPSARKQVWNLATSIADFVASGCSLAEQQLYEARMAICDECPTDRRSGGRCAGCGCNLAVKARATAMKCPDGHWPKS